jgi:hypothetical protein
MQLSKEKEYGRKKNQAPPTFRRSPQNLYHSFPSKGTTRGKEAPSSTQQHSELYQQASN